MPGKMTRSDPRPNVRVTRVLVAVSISRLSCKRAGKTDIDAGLGFLWKISAKGTGGCREPLTQLDAVSQFWSDQSEADMPRTRSAFRFDVNEHHAAL